VPLLRAYDDSKGSGTCRTCGASIWWMALTSGKRHPFNAAAAGAPPPHAFEEMQVGRRVLAIDASYSHFATCKDAKDWKKK
jgi:hypothetical protein